MDPFIEPLHSNVEPGPRLQMKALLDLTTWPNETPKQARESVHHLVRLRLVESRGVVGNGPNARNLFALSDVAVTKILRSLTLMGVSGDTLHKASAACYTWVYEWDNKPKTYHPITYALFDCAKAQSLGKVAGWWLRVDVFMSEAGRETSACIYPAGDDLQPTEKLPVGTILVSLTDILEPLATELRRFVFEETAAKNLQ